jgi:hypothetical protein
MSIFLSPVTERGLERTVERSVGNVTESLVWLIGNSTKVVQDSGPFARRVFTAVQSGRRIGKTFKIFSHPRGWRNPVAYLNGGACVLSSTSGVLDFFSILPQTSAACYAGSKVFGSAADTMDDSFNIWTSVLF